MDAIELLANPECPHCVRIVDEITLAAEAQGLTVAGVDLLQHPEEAAGHGWEHSPMMRVGDRLYPARGDPADLRALIERAKRDAAAEGSA